MHVVTNFLRRRMGPYSRPLTFVVGFVAAAVLIAFIVSFSGGWFGSHGSLTRPYGDHQSADLASRESRIDPQSVIFSKSVLPIAAPEARALNASRPLDVAHPHPAKPFSVEASALSSPAFAAALHCLAQAVYYEAGNQGESGERAVAQVVLNRVRHPAFPHTVCGVVYQGFARPTGCQFTFTCDGSLVREPSKDGWQRANQVAREALAGRVDRDVGLATHYHADYVVPYWARTLAKVSRVGVHLFYQLPGRLGAASAFDARYDLAGELASSPRGSNIATEPETSEAPEKMLASPEQNVNSALLSDTERGRLIVEKGDLRKNDSQLGADTRSGSLIIGRKSSLVIDERLNPKQ